MESKLLMTGIAYIVLLAELEFKKKYLHVTNTVSNTNSQYLMVGLVWRAWFGIPVVEGPTILVSPDCPLAFLQATVLSHLFFLVQQCFGTLAYR
jgi:hypothetical protein